MYLGIEIGGTKLQLGIGDGNGAIDALWRGTVVPADGADGIRRQIENAVPELLANAQRKRDELKGVGIGFGGPVDDSTRTVIKSHQIQGWDGFPLASWIEQMLRLPAALGNDADVAGLAEALFGAGKGLTPIFYITIGSGIGGGLIINGEIYRGCGRGAAEIGHLRLMWPDLSQNLRSYLLEEVASGWGIEETARRIKWDNPRNFLPSLQKDITVASLVKAAEGGDQGAGCHLSGAWEALSQGICHVIALLCPRRIVIGGGVSLIGEKWFFTPLRKLVATRVFEPFADCYDIVPAALGEAVVVHGALALARKRFAQ